MFYTSNQKIQRLLRFGVAGCLSAAMWCMGAVHLRGQTLSLPDVIESVQPKMVKIFGGGGLRRLESWQTGFFVSNDGLIVTVWSYVLDSETTVVLADGRRATAELLGYHPQYELALLKVDVQDQPFFNPDLSVKGVPGTTVLAFSNLYGVANGNEQCSVQSGVVSAVVPLNARRGNRRTSYQGPAIIVDAITNNPGAAGGAVTNRQGQWLGLIGRESRSAESDLWLNYAIPAAQVTMAMDLILAGKTNENLSVDREPTEPITLELMGLVMVPNVVARTPPFIDQVTTGSAAERSGLQKDDLIVEVGGKVTTSFKDLQNRLRQIDRDSQVSLMIQRGDQFINVTLQANQR